jgi:hypothetical protein
MAEQIHLAPGEQPPNREEWVMVLQTANGKFSVVTSRGISDPTVWYKMDLFPFSEALQRAELDAVHLGLKQIYLKRIDPL